ncbi:hypothetical protein SUDANB95_02639 [Actinosynnema sp. ALI-1.44]
MGWSLDAIIEPVATIATKFLGDRAEGERSTLLLGAEAAAAPHPGWLAATASAECVSAWQARLRRLGEDVDRAADAVNDSMGTYVDADRSAADALRAQAEWFTR